MTSMKSCAALAAILVLSAGAAMAQPYGPDQPGDPSDYGPPPPPPGERDQGGDQQRYGPPPSSGQWGQGAYPPSNRSQQARYQHQLRVYEHARRDYDMQFGPGAYERYYAAPPPLPGQ
jgi:hypothetical protein